jgi:predicted PurR-regulated permease PerM
LCQLSALRQIYADSDRHRHLVDVMLSEHRNLAAAVTIPIPFGSAIAITAWPLRQFLVRHGMGRGLAALLLFFLSIVIVLVPTLVIAPHITDQLERAAQQFQSFFSSTPEQPAWIADVPLIGRRLNLGWDKIVAAEGNVRILIEPYTVEVERWMVAAAGALAESLVQVILSLIAACMFWANGEGLISVLHDALRRLGGPVAEHALDVAGSAVRGVASGVIGTAATQTVILAFGLTLAGVPGIAILSFIAFLLAISQVGAPLLIAIRGGAALALPA